MPEYSDDEKDEIVRKVCEDIAAGMLVKDACVKHGTNRDSLTRWTQPSASQTRSDLYARAREQQSHAFAEQCLTLADKATAEDWQVTRLRVDTRKWYVSKIAPKLYGEKIDVTSGGEKVASAIVIMPPEKG